MCKNLLLKSERAYNKSRTIVNDTPLQHNIRLSRKYNCNLYIKREDLQTVRSFKIRGAFNKILNLYDKEKLSGVVCASAGNHAQGVALSCQTLKIKGDIFIPEQTPIQKVDRVKYFGGEWCNVYQVGKNFNDCLNQALQFCQDNKKTLFIHTMILI